jgi:hypothetical protein
MKGFDSEQLANKVAISKGFQYFRHLIDGKPTCELRSAETGELFVAGPDAASILPVIWSLPSIANRYPKPTAKTLVEEIAARRGYGVVSASNRADQIAFTDPTGAAIATAPFWSMALSVALKLSWLVDPPRPAPKRLPRQDRAVPVTPYGGGRSAAHATRNVLISTTRRRVECPATRATAVGAANAPMTRRRQRESGRLSHWELLRAARRPRESLRRRESGRRACDCRGHREQPSQFDR